MKGGPNRVKAVISQQPPPSLGRKAYLPGFKLISLFSRRGFYYKVFANMLL
jgi:hypothetical protein